MDFRAYEYNGCGGLTKINPHWVKKSYTTLEELEKDVRKHKKRLGQVIVVQYFKKYSSEIIIILK